MWVWDKPFAGAEESSGLQIWAFLGSNSAIPKERHEQRKGNLKYLWLKQGDCSLGINIGYVLENWESKSDHMHMR